MTETLAKKGLAGDRLCPTLRFGFWQRLRAIPLLSNWDKAHEIIHEGN
jgi:hypothetical protein